jgi:hypothetical protein
VTITVQPYTKPSLLDVSMFRSDDEGTAAGSGGYVRFYAKSVFSSIDSENEATMEGRVYMKGGEPSAYTGMTSETAWIGGGGTLLPYKSYIANIRITDLLYDYTFTVEIPTETVLLHGLDGVAGAAIGKYSELPGYFESAFPLIAPSLYGHRNLLHNWDFRNPVNQRGISGAYTEPTYTIDRWVKTNYATITFNANSLDFIQFAILEQRFEGHGLAGKVVTFSLDVGGIITAITTSFPTSTGEIDAYIGSNWEIKTMYTAGYMAVWFASLVVVSDIRRVKLELGTVSTLAYDPPMDYGVELPKCQRFYQLRSVNNVAAEDMRPLMRITNPTITGTGPYAYSADL